MYNLGFRNFIDELLAKAKAGHFIGKSKELAEYQTMFEHGLRKFGMHKMDRNAVIDELRQCGIRPVGDGRWRACTANIGKTSADGAGRSQAQRPRAMRGMRTALQKEQPARRSF
jgi:hypothetical protein